LGELGDRGVLGGLCAADPESGQDEGGREKDYAARPDGEPDVGVSDESDDAASNAEREVIVNQQDAALPAIDQAEAADEHTDEDPMGGEAPTG